MLAGERELASDYLLEALLQSLHALQLAEADAKGTGTRAQLAEAIKVRRATPPTSKVALIHLGSYFQEVRDSSVVLVRGTACRYARQPVCCWGGGDSGAWRMQSTVMCRGRKHSLPNPPKS